MMKLLKGNNFWVIIILLVFAFFYILTIARSEGTKCLMNPLQYAAAGFTKSNGQAFYGYGYLKVPNSPILYFDANSTYLVTGNPAVNQNMLVVPEPPHK